MFVLQSAQSFPQKNNVGCSSESVQTFQKKKSQLFGPKSVANLYEKLMSVVCLKSLQTFPKSLQTFRIIPNRYFLWSNSTALGFAKSGIRFCFRSIQGMNNNAPGIGISPIFITPLYISTQIYFRETIIHMLQGFAAVS